MQIYERSIIVYIYVNTVSISLSTGIDYPRSLHEKLRIKNFGIYINMLSKKKQNCQRNNIFHSSVNAVCVYW